MWPTVMQITETNERFMEKVQQSNKGLVWDTNMAAVSLFWDTDIADVTSSENAHRIEKINLLLNSKSNCSVTETTIVTITTTTMYTFKRKQDQRTVLANCKKCGRCCNMVEVKRSVKLFHGRLTPELSLILNFLLRSPPFFN